MIRVLISVADLLDGGCKIEQLVVKHPGCEQFEAWEEKLLKVTFRALLHSYSMPEFAFALKGSAGAELFATGDFTIRGNNKEVLEAVLKLRDIAYTTDEDPADDQGDY